MVKSNMQYSQIITIGVPVMFIEDIGKLKKNKKHNRKSISFINAMKSLQVKHDEKVNKEVNKPNEMHKIYSPNKYNTHGRSISCTECVRKCNLRGKVNQFQTVCMHINRGKSTTNKVEQSCIGASSSSIAYRSKNTLDKSIVSTDDIPQFYHFSKQRISQKPFSNEIGHLFWNGNNFEASHPTCLPTRLVGVSVMVKEQRRFLGIIARSTIQTTRHTKMMVYTDTCAQVCVSDPSILNKLDITKDELIPTRHKIISVTEQPLKIKGIVFVEITVGDLRTYQPLYISENIKGFFLTKDAQIDMGILPPDYPMRNCALESLCLYNGIFSNADKQGSKFQKSAKLKINFPAERKNHLSIHPPTHSDDNPTKATRESQSTNIASEKTKIPVNFRPVIPVSNCDCKQRTYSPPRPTFIPYEAISENREKLEMWIVNYYACSAFNKCRHSIVPKISADTLTIHFKDNVEPHAVHNAISVPRHWKKEVKAAIDRDVALNTLKPMPMGLSSIWCTQMAVVANDNGSPRRVMDYQTLNAATYRKTYHPTPPFRQVSSIPPNAKKTILEFCEGYHSITLSSAASLATTFITEWGYYRYRIAPQILHAAGDEYRKTYDEITKVIPNIIKIGDKTVLWEIDLTEAFWQTIDYLTNCIEHGIVFDVETFNFGKDEVDFAGYTITNEDLRPAEEITDTLKNFPVPKTITDIHYFIGLANQIAYTNTNQLQPFKEVLNGKIFYWNQCLDLLFRSVIDMLVKQITNGFRRFNVDKQICLCTDWCKTGLGFILLQKHCSCDDAKSPNCCITGWRTVYVGSRFTSEDESRYTPNEGEALALVYGLQKCNTFITNCSRFIIAVDHKPLVKIFNDTLINSIGNQTLFKLKEKTLRYKFDIKYCPGVINGSADALSRRPSLIN